MRTDAAECDDEGPRMTGPITSLKMLGVSEAATPPVSQSPVRYRYSMAVAVRKDLVDVHRHAWEHIASPGSWWTGAQRVRIAEIALGAINADDPLPPWVGLSSSDRYSDDGVIPSTAVDITYRIARHAGTITESVYESVTTDVGELPYVELCTVVSMVAAVSTFHRNAGLETPALPTPKRGEPTGERPDKLAAAELNWVPVSAPADQVAAVVQAYTAVPSGHEVTWRLGAAQYMPSEEMVHPDWVRRADGLTRPEAELIAARVAQLRECFY